MRATNSYYRQQIRMSSFNIYFTRASKLPEIVDYLAENYGNIPLGLHFKKSVDTVLDSYAEHIWKLSNLTALSFDFLSQYVNYRVPTQHYSNFQRLKNLVEFPHFPTRDRGDYLNLRAINLSKYDNHDITQMTNIEELTNNDNYMLRDQDPLNILPNPDRVTSITLKKRNIDLTVLTRFKNIKSLEYSDTAYNERNNMLSKLTTFKIWSSTTHFTTTTIT